MRSSTRKFSQISILLILILKTSLVLATRPENSMIVNLLEESSSSDRFLQNNNNNNNNNQYSCETGKWCTLTIRQGNLGVQYSIVMNPNSYLTTMVSLVSTPDSALTIAYSSTSASTDIETELTVSGYGQRSLTLEIPTTNSFSAVVPQDTIEQYDGGAVYFSVDNGSSGSTTVTIKATFASGSSSSSSSGSGSYTSDDNSGVSMMTIILPIAAALLVIFILGLCCHYRRKRLEQQRMARAMGGRHRVRGARRDRGGDQQADDEEDEDDEVEDPLTEDNIKDRFPEAKFDALKSSFPQTTCSVCLEEFQKGVACRQLYCEHMFHSECIRLWLTNQLKKGHAFCPNCNKNMMNKPSEAPEAPEGPEVPEEPEAQAPNVEIQA